MNRDQIQYGGTLKALGTSQYRLDMVGGGSDYRVEVPIGYMYWDTEQKRPVWWSGADWVDATGAVADIL